MMFIELREMIDHAYSVMNRINCNLPSVRKFNRAFFLDLASQIHENGQESPKQHQLALARIDECFPGP